MVNFRNIKSKHKEYFKKPFSQKRILLLQGPVGPFFKKLQLFLQNKEYDIWRICFNPADTLFSLKRRRINFLGNLEEWENWFRDFLSVVQIDHIILFASERPLHQIARKVARELDIKVISLEEGYLRPGNITVEFDGNNISSPIKGEIPPVNYQPLKIKSESFDFKGFKYMALYATFYYVIRNIFSLRSQRSLFHKDFFIILEGLYWLRNIYRRIWLKSFNEELIRTLCDQYKGQYFLIPLQVSYDSQLKKAACGWNSIRLISSVLTAFEKGAPKDAKLVFKIHPLQRGYNDERKHIHQMAKALNIGDRVDIIEIGLLDPLTENAAGMITINSTSGLSAIHHGIPLLVVGDAFYAHKDFAICAHGKPDYNKFWKNKSIAESKVRKNYLRWLKDVALKPGDFYAPEGIKYACQSVLEKIESIYLK